MAKKKNTLLVTVIVVSLITAYAVFGYFIYIKYYRHQINRLHEEGGVLWFKSALEENDTCSPDVIEWRLTFYHRDPESSKLMFLMDCLLHQPKLLKNEDYVNYVTQFAASASQNDKSIIKDLLNTETASYGDDAQTIKKIIGDIATHAEHLESPEPDSRKNMELLWAEFLATGEDAPVEKIINVLAFPENDNKWDLQKYAMDSLFNHFFFPNGVDQILKREAREAEGRKKELIDDILAETSALTDKAGDHLYRGHNYEKFNKYDKALEEYEQALKLFPYYPSAYARMAVVHEYKGDREKAFECAKKAAELDPDEKVISYNLGRHYFMRREYDDAITYYSRALKDSTDNARYNHALARAYQEKGDHANAIKYFKQYLKLAPHGEFEQLVRGYLASVNVTIKEDPSDLVFMLEKKQYKRLDEHLGAVLRSRGKNNEGYSLLDIAYESLFEQIDRTELYDRWLKHFEDWQKAESNSHFANAAVGIFYIKYAWEARGSGFSSTVVSEGRKLFRQRLTIAREYLEKAYRLDPSDPIVPSELIVVSKGLGLDREQMEIQFQRAVKADDTVFEPYRAKLDYLKPKWYGSREEMFEFAREAATTARDNTLVPRILAQAHWAAHLRLKRIKDDNSYFQDDNAYHETKDVYLHLMETFPESAQSVNWLARTAYLAGDYTTAKAAFDQIGDRWLKNCWGNINYFKKIKHEVLNHTVSTGTPLSKINKG